MPFTFPKDGMTPLYYLQQYFVDKETGEALAAGVVTFYLQSDEVTLKPIYALYETSPNVFEYVELPNPLTLSAVGTPVDAAGNDVVIYVYPFDDDGNVEPYYVTVDSALGVRQFIRDQVPSDVEGINPPSSRVDNFQNMIVNGSFLYNVGTVTANSNLITVLAAGASQGLIQPDIILRKDNGTALDTVTFNRPSAADIAEIQALKIAPPDFYATYNCTNIPLGEGLKQIEFPIAPHVSNLSNTEITISVVARSASGTLTFVVNQYFGTGGTPSPTVNLSSTPQMLTPTFDIYKVVITVPSIAAKTIGTNGDDYISIGFQPTLNSINTTDITCAMVQLGDKSTIVYEYETNQITAGKVFAPRTGEVKLGYFVPTPGWLPMDDGTIGNASSNATSRAYVDTFPLYSLLWNQIDNAWAPLYTSAGVPAARGISASADFAANNQLSLTKALGCVFAGINPRVTGFSQTYTTVFATNNELTMPASLGTETGSAVTVSSTGTLSAPLEAGVVYYSIKIDPLHMALALTPADAFFGNQITLTSNGSGVQSVRTYLGSPIFNRNFTADTSADTLTVDNTEGLYFGTPVQVRAGTGGTLPSPLTANDTYFVMPIDSTTIQLASDIANAFAGTPINITTTGTAPNFLFTENTVNVLGQVSGQESHFQTTPEVGAHQHFLNIFSATAGAGAAAHSDSADASNPSNVTGYIKEGATETNLNNAFNIRQPTTFANVYIKL